MALPGHPRRPEGRVITYTYRDPTGLACHLMNSCSTYLSLTETYCLQKYNLLEFCNAGLLQRSSSGAGDTYAYRILLWEFIRHSVMGPGILRILRILITRSDGLSYYKLYLASPVASVWHHLPLSCASTVLLLWCTVSTVQPETTLPKPRDSKSNDETWAWVSTTWAWGTQALGPPPPKYQLLGVEHH